MLKDTGKWTSSNGNLTIVLIEPFCEVESKPLIFWFEELQIVNGDFQIENSRVINNCSKVERVPDPEGDFESIQIHTTLEIDVTINGEKKSIPAEVITKLSDEENKEIVEWTSNPNIS